MSALAPVSVVDGTQSRHAVTGDKRRALTLFYGKGNLGGDVAKTHQQQASTAQCRDALITRPCCSERPTPKLVRLDPHGASPLSDAMLELITGLNLDVQVTPPEAPWHLSVLGTVQQLVKRSASLHARDEGRTSTCAERLLLASTAHNRLLKRGGFTRCQLLPGHEREPSEGEPVDPQRDGLDLTSYVAERHVRQQSANKAWPEAEAEHRVSRAQNMRLRNHQNWPSGTRINWSGATSILSRRMERERKTKNTFLGLRWCLVKSGDEHKKVDTSPRKSFGLS